MGVNLDHQKSVRPPLEVRNLNVNLGGRPVLTDVNLCLPAGTLMGLVGPNGAGKTTLLRTILGLLRPASGQILLSGQSSQFGQFGQSGQVSQNIQTRQASEISQISQVKKVGYFGRLSRRQSISKLGYVPQRHEFAWDFPISIEGVVTSGLTGQIGWFGRLQKTHYQSVYRALEQVKLVDLHTRPVAELSGGQRQRVLIARALATNPAVLLLDEPFTGLDQPSMDLLSDLFLELTAQGVAILMSTHDLGGAIDICHQLALLKGTITASGTPQELRDPQIWMRTYGVRPNSSLLRTVGITDASLIASAVERVAQEEE